MANIIITVNNNKCKLHGELKTLMLLQKAFNIKHPNAWHVRRFMPAGWDGLVKYITDAAYFKIGLLQDICKWLEDNGHTIEFDDLRFKMVKPKLPTKIGDHTPRPYQDDAINSVITNHAHGLSHYVGIINAATNAGKTTIMAGIWLAFKKEHKALVLINDSDLYNQFKTEIPKLVGDDFGCVRGKEIQWGNFTIAMVQTLSRNIQKFKSTLAQYEIVLVDECDLGDNKTYKTVLQNCFNARVKVGLSGSIYVSKLKKHEMKNQNLRCFFGNELYIISKREMADKGFSTKLRIKMILGNTAPGIRGDFKAEYDQNITRNNKRHLVSLTRTKRAINKGRLPALIVVQFHEHLDNLYKVYTEALGDTYIVKGVHHKTPNRKQILEDFRDGKIDILISTFIIKRGKNFPLLKYLQNAAGSDSQETILQLMGRMERTNESKKTGYIEDIWDEGIYLLRHSKHRYNYYKKQGFPVIKRT
jgi:superfamily II DNA or RNA helicase